MGNFDEREYERREKKLSEIESDSEEQPEEYQGEIRFETDDSTKEMLDHLNKMKNK